MPPRKKSPPNLRPLGKVLREFREALGLSQEKFAIEYDFDRSTIGGIERGTRNIAFSTTRELLIAAGKSWSEFGRAMDERDPLPSSKGARRRR